MALGWMATGGRFEQRCGGHTANAFGQWCVAMHTEAAAAAVGFGFEVRGSHPGVNWLERSEAELPHVVEAKSVDAAHVGCEKRVIRPAVGIGGEMLWDAGCCGMRLRRRDDRGCGMLWDVGCGFGGLIQGAGGYGTREDSVGSGRRAEAEAEARRGDARLLAAGPLLVNGFSW